MKDTKLPSLALRKKAHPSYRSITKEGVLVYRASVAEKSTELREMLSSALSLFLLLAVFILGYFFTIWAFKTSINLGNNISNLLMPLVSGLKYGNIILIFGALISFILAAALLRTLWRIVRNRRFIKRHTNNYRKFNENVMESFAFSIRRQVMKNEIFDLLEEIQPDLIYCNECLALEASIRAKKKLNIPLIYDAHEFYDNLEGNNADYLSKIYSSIHRVSFPQIDAFVTVSDAILELYRLAEYQLPQNTLVLSNSIPPAKLDKYDGRLHIAAEIPETQNILLYQGGISLRRKVDEVALAAKDMPEGWTVVIMGNGADAEEIEQMIETINNEYFFDRAMKMIKNEFRNEYNELYQKHLDEICGANEGQIAIGVVPSMQSNVATTTTSASMQTNGPNVKALSTLLERGFHDFFKLSRGTLKRISTRKIAMQEKLTEHLKTTLNEWGEDLVGFRLYIRRKESELAHQFAFIEMTTKRKFEVAKRAAIIPPVPNEDLLNWTQGAKIGIIPYPISCQNHWGAAPNKLWEYPTAGVPLMVTPSQTMFKVINEYGAGWLLSSDPTAKEIKDQIAMLKPADFEKAKKACELFIKESNWSIHSIPWVDMVKNVGFSNEKG